MNFAYNSVFFLLFISFKHLQFSFLRIHQINMVFLLRYRTGIGQLIFDFSPLKVFWSNWLFSINKPEIISFLGVFAFSVFFTTDNSWGRLWRWTRCYGDMFHHAPVWFTVWQSRILWQCHRPSFNILQFGWTMVWCKLHSRKIRLHASRKCPVLFINIHFEKLLEWNVYSQILKKFTESNSLILISLPVSEI